MQTDLLLPGRLVIQAVKHMARKKNVTVLRALYRAHDDTNSQRNQIQPTRDRSCAVRRGVVHAKGVPVPANGGDDIDGTTGGPCRNES
jgi:hypothetical protein